MKYITNHNTNRDLEMKIRTFTEIGSYMNKNSTKGRSNCMLYGPKISVA